MFQRCVETTFEKWKQTTTMPGLVHIFVGYACLVGLLVQVVVGILKYRILAPWGDELSSVFATCLSFFVIFVGFLFIFWFCWDFWLCCSKTLFMTVSFHKPCNCYLQVNSTPPIWKTLTPLLFFTTCVIIY